MENTPKKNKLIEIAPLSVTLPSKGLVYSEDNPFSSGEVPLKYGTAKNRDILFNQRYINNGTAIDMFIKSLMVDNNQKMAYDTLLSSDRDFLTIMARVMVLKENYDVKITCPVCGEQTLHHFNLMNLKIKDIDYSILNRNNEYKYVVKGNNNFPDIEFTFKFLTVKDLKDIELLRKNQKKVSQLTNENTDFFVTARLLKQIISIKNIQTGIEYNKPLEIREAITEELPGFYISELLKYIKNIEPGLDLTVEFVCEYCGYTEEKILPIDFKSLFFPEG